MALPTNIFVTKVGVLNQNNSIIYTSPTGYVGVVLLAQVANIGSTTETINFYHRRTVLLSGSNSSNLKYVVSLLETLSN